MATQPSDGPPPGCGREGGQADRGTAAPCGRHPRPAGDTARWNRAGEPRLPPVTRLLRSLYLVPQAGAQGYLTAGGGAALPEPPNSGNPI